jgi:hypothetical protein
LYGSITNAVRSSLAGLFRLLNPPPEGNLCLLNQVGYYRKKLSPV